MSAAASGRPGGRLLFHLTVQIVLVLLYFLPGGLLWNRVEPVVFGLPFSVFVTALVLPALFVVNMILYVLGHWAQDGLVTSEVRRAQAPGSPVPPSGHTGPAAGSGDEEA